MAKRRGKAADLALTALAAAPLLGLLAVVVWYAVHAWLSLGGTPLPTTAYVAMGLGIFFSVAVGCGLMMLLFYSSRHGYDEPYQFDDEGPGRWLPHQVDDEDPE